MNNIEIEFNRINFQCEKGNLLFIKYFSEIDVVLVHFISLFGINQLRVIFFFFRIYIEMTFKHYAKKKHTNLLFSFGLDDFPCIILIGSSLLIEVCDLLSMKHIVHSIFVWFFSLIKTLKCSFHHTLFIFVCKLIALSQKYFTTSQYHYQFASPLLLYAVFLTLQIAISDLIYLG